MPRLVDAFATVHPFSNGFTCGAKDNSFTFSTQPLHMERRVAPPPSSAASATGSDGAVVAALPREASATPAKQRNKPDAGSAPSSGDRGGAQSTAQRRRRFNSSPHDPSLQPSDASLRASRSYGEHVLLLASTQVNADSDAAGSACATAEPADAADSAASHATGIADATAAHARSPLAWVDDESPKRIDYVMTSAPLQPVRCRCQWDLMQLPFQTLASDDPAVTAAAASCTCAPHMARLESPGALWKVVSASVFKQYMLEADGRMSSVSDHHGVSVTLQLQFKDAPATASSAVPPLPQQHSSTVIISQHTPGATDAAAAASPASIETLVSPRLSLRKRKLVRSGRDVGEEAELFSLDDCGSAIPAPRTASSRSGSPFLSDANERAGSSSSAVADCAPRLPTSTLLLLASGVLWMGLRDATDRRSAHLLRMGRAFAIFAIGSRSLWIFLLNMYFESIMVEMILPAWLIALPWPAALAACFRLFFAVIDLAHTFLPIYIVVEYLLTTFPAKVDANKRQDLCAPRPSRFPISPSALSLTCLCLAALAHAVMLFRVVGGAECDARDYQRDGGAATICTGARTTTSTSSGGGGSATAAESIVSDSRNSNHHRRMHARRIRTIKCGYIQDSTIYLSLRCQRACNCVSSCSPASPAQRPPDLSSFSSIICIFITCSHLQLISFKPVLRIRRRVQATATSVRGRPERAPRRRARMCAYAQLDDRSGGVSGTVCSIVLCCEDSMHMRMNTLYSATVEALASPAAGVSAGAASPLTAASAEPSLAASTEDAPAAAVAAVLSEMMSETCIATVVLFLLPSMFLPSRSCIRWYSSTYRLCCVLTASAVSRSSEFCRAFRRARDAMDMSRRARSFAAAAARNELLLDRQLCTAQRDEAHARAYRQRGKSQHEESELSPLRWSAGYSKVC